jgi:hypothetical protein
MSTTFSSDPTKPIVIPQAIGVWKLISKFGKD